jgi:hypothetical protein
MRFCKIFEKYSQTIPRSMLFTAMEVFTATMSLEGDVLSIFLERLSSHD